jgi:general secretion pathway protein B
MSYILDALKKAESERKLGSVPNVHAQSVPVATSEAGSSVWSRASTWIVLIALAITVGVLAWLKPWQAVPVSNTSASLPEQSPSKIEDAESKSPSVQPPLSAASSAFPAVSSAFPPVTAGNAELAATAPPANAVLPAEALPAEPAKPKIRPKLARKSTEKKQARSAEPSKPVVSAAEQEPVPASDPSPETRIATLRELPENIQREIPALTIGGYIYSGNQSERSILINNRLLHEGEEVEPGLVLEKMLPNEAVLSYKGHRYRISY